MSRVRVAIRGGLACVWTAGMVSWLYLRAATAGRLSGADERALRASHARTAAFHRWSRGMLRILSVRTEVVGRPPKSPFILVTNHLSYLDIMLIGAHVPAVFLSKSEVDDWPVVGALCRAAETLYIDRAAKKSLPEVIEQIRRVTEAGRGVVLFPEGTTSEGREVARFRPPLLEMAARGAIPVNYATLGYWTPEGGGTARESVCWWGTMEFAPHLVRLLSLRSIDARLTFGEAAIESEDRKELAARLEEAVARAFVPVTGCDGAPDPVMLGRRRAKGRA